MRILAYCKLSMGNTFLLTIFEGEKRIISWYTWMILHLIKSSPHGAEYICQRIKSALVQIMACHLFGTKPLSKPVLDYCQLDPWEQNSVIKIQKFSFTEMHLKISSAIMQMTFWHAFFLMKFSIFQFKFQWSLFLKAHSAISQHWVS